MSMKLKKAKIIVEPVDTTKMRWLKALDGKIKSKKGEELISVPTWDVLGRILSPARLQILVAIPLLKPKSIADLARLMKKNFKNIHSDVKFLANLGLIELKEKGTTRKTLVPIAKYQGIELMLAA